jgi:RNA polymerase sigma-70 factor (ECF subfamily)
MIKNEEHIQQLLSEAGSGSRKSMGHLATIVWERLYPFVFRITFNPDATEDILQETLLTMVGQVNSLREIRRFWSWVYRIAWNKIQDNLKRSRLQSSGKASLLWNQPHNGQVVNDSLLEAKIHEETLQQVSEGIEQLSRQHRDVLRLRYYEQLPYREIASLTRTTPEMARVRFYRAKKRLKARMLACCV